MNVVKGSLNVIQKSFQVCMADKDAIANCDTLAKINITKQAGADIDEKSGSTHVGFLVKVPPGLSPTENGCISYNKTTGAVDGGPSTVAQIKAEGTTKLDGTYGKCTP